MRTGRRIAGGCLIVLLVLLIANIVLAVAVPWIGAIEFSVLKSLVKPPKPVPFSTTPLQAQITLWQGKLYAIGPNGSTGVYNPTTGKLLATLPGLVVCSDDQLLYTAKSALSFEGVGQTHPSPLTLPFVARTSAGASLWTYSAGSQIIVQAQSSGSFVYLLLLPTGTNVSTVYSVVALNQLNGAVAWNYSGPVHVTATQFVIADTMLYLQIGAAVIALDANDGHQLWQHAAVANSITSDGERLYLLDNQALHVLSSQSGTELWSGIYQPAKFGASVLFDGVVVYFRNLDSQIVAMRARDGHTLWRSAPSSDTVRSLVAAQDGNLYLFQNDPTSAAGSKLVALRGATGQQTWETEKLAFLVSDITLIGAEQGIVYFSNAVGRSELSGLSTRLVAFSESSGTLLWQQDLAEIGGAALLTGQSLYVAALLHHRRVSGVNFSRRVTDCSDIAGLYALSATSGAIQSQHTQSFPCKYDNFF
jgi:outer membrane protein assembly factor BamB